MTIFNLYVYDVSEAGFLQILTLIMLLSFFFLRICLAEWDKWGLNTCLYVNTDPVWVGYKLGGIIPYVLKSCSVVTHGEFPN